jgi:hypothetical protein
VTPAIKGIYRNWNKPVELLAITTDISPNNLKYFGGAQKQYREAYFNYRGEPESIIQAAIRHPDGTIYSVSQPGRHYNVVALMSTINKGGYDNYADQGFITSHGRYVDRREAYMLARIQNQMARRSERLLMDKHAYNGTELYSEDIW